LGVAVKEGASMRRIIMLAAVMAALLMVTAVPAFASPEDVFPENSFPPGEGPLVGSPAGFEGQGLWTACESTSCDERTSSKVRPNDLVIVKRLDKASPVLIS